jgi:segregation and condensation protein A
LVGGGPSALGPDLMTDTPKSDDAPEPVAEGANAVRIELPEFEGPLDLLLHLVKKHELEIFDIPIAFITEKYLEHIRVMHALNLDIAGEYLLMAATLAYLKSRELVPPTAEELAAEAAALAEADEEVGDPRQELIKRLLEYQKYKEAAAQLGGRPVMGRNVWTRGARAEDIAGIPSSKEAPLAEVPVFKLIEALEKVLAKARVKLTHDVVVDRISITDKINEIVDRLDKEPTFTFASCFDFLEQGEGVVNLRHQVVITFLALLEMTRLKMIKLHQPADRGEIYVARGGADLNTARASARGDDEFRG